MKISVKVIAHASRDAIEDLGDNKFKVWVRAVPENGKANMAVIKILALNFEVEKSAVRLLSGHTSG